MKILVINSGSSSIKFQLITMPDEIVLAAGLIDRIGSDQANICFNTQQTTEKKQVKRLGNYPDYQSGLKDIIHLLKQFKLLNSAAELKAIGHRVVHGGNKFHAATLIDANVIEQIRELIPLAPLHNAPNLVGIEVCSQLFPSIPQVAVFDTAFHYDLPLYAKSYALAKDISEKLDIRRYGFHGLSHDFVSQALADFLQQKREHLNIISLHLGNGASACAIQAGKSIDTSMGFTPSEGLVMGSRCGDIDPALIPYLQQKLSLSNQEIEQMINKESGLKGLCGYSDMREIEQLAQQQNQDAQLALDVFCYRIKKYIGAYIAILGKVDAIIFTGGIGENSKLIPPLICQGLLSLGIIYDKEKATTSAAIMALHADSSPIAIYKVATNEELEIARQTNTSIKLSDSATE